MMKKAFIVVSAIICSIILYIAIVLVWNKYEGRRSHEMGVALSFRNTDSVYNIKLQNNRVIRIEDPYNKFIRSYGAKSAKIFIDFKNIRNVVFTEPVILKTVTDSIDANNEHVKYKGYMGIWTDNVNFRVVETGDIEEVYNK